MLRQLNKEYRAIRFADRYINNEKYRKTADGSVQIDMSTLSLREFKTLFDKYLKVANIAVSDMSDAIYRSLQQNVVKFQKKSNAILLAADELEKYFEEAERAWSIKKSSAFEDFKTENGVLKRYIGKDENVIIPNIVNSIAACAFSPGYGNKSNLKAVNIPNSVTYIGNSAFSCCYNLSSINIPKYVTSIGDYAFEYCENLSSLSILSGITYIGNSAFFDCRKLIIKNIPNGVTSIGECTFSFCSSLTRISIPRSVSFIGECAFSNCKNLKTIYCEARTKPTGWSENWLGNCPAQVIWNYKG